MSTAPILAKLEILSPPVQGGLPPFRCISGSLNSLLTNGEVIHCPSNLERLPCYTSYRPFSAVCHWVPIDVGRHTFCLYRIEDHVRLSCKSKHRERLLHHMFGSR